MNISILSNIEILDSSTVSDKTNYKVTFNASNENYGLISEQRLNANIPTEFTFDPLNQGEIYNISDDINKIQNFKIIKE